MYSEVWLCLVFQTSWLQRPSHTCIFFWLVKTVYLRESMLFIMAAPLRVHR